MTDPRAGTPAAATSKNSRAIVLIVDDDAASRRLLARALEAVGYVVTVAGGGAEAILLVEKSAPNVILLDFEMPGLNGTETCARLRQHERPELRNIPIIMLTAHDSEGDEVSCLGAGANDFVTKPTTRGSLTARIETQLRLRALNEELRGQNDELARWRTAQVADLEAARHIQRAILPTRWRVPGWKISARYLPIIQVGGDMYGVEPLADGAMVWLADATGHGVAAALSTSLVALLFHRAANAANPAQVLARVNAGLFGIFQGKSVMSAICAQCFTDGRILVAGAGHPPMLVRRSDAWVEGIESQGTLLGIDADWSCEARSVHLAPGDGALLFSDGLHSSRHAGGERQMPEDIAATFSTYAKLADLIQRMRGGQAFDDDLSAILLRRNA